MMMAYKYNYDMATIDPCTFTIFLFSKNDFGMLKAEYM